MLLRITVRKKNISETAENPSSYVLCASDEKWLRRVLYTFSWVSRSALIRSAFPDQRPSQIYLDIGLSPDVHLQ